MIQKLSAITLFLVFCSQAMADDVTQVRQTIREFYSALNESNFDKVNQFLLPEGFTEFSSRGGLKLDIANAQLEQLINSGLEVHVALRDIEVFVSGEMAYATYYRVGTIERPDKDNNVPSHTARVTSVWIKQGGSWLLKHVHNSRTGS
jgi:ketosteroid isomerase-like protein